MNHIALHRYCLLNAMMLVMSSSAVAQFTNFNLTNEAKPQNEPCVRISRANANNIVAVFRDFRLGYSGNNPARRIGYVYSNNGGANWSTSALLPAPQSPYITQSDPVVTSDADGNFYISSVSRKSNKPGKEENDIIVYRSTNNGQTFSFRSVAIATPKPCKSCNDNGEDKEWMICDPIATSPTYNNVLITSSRQINWLVRFVKSTNGGASWTSPVQVSDAGNSGNGSNLAVGTDGHIYVVWAGSTAMGVNGVRFDKSTNGGASFGTDQTLSTNSLSIRNEGGPFICVDYSAQATRGNVYVVWTDSRNGTQDVWFQRSTNSGTSWLATPIRVNDVATGNQYKPAIQCGENGVLYTIFYDTRSGALYSYLAYSTNAGDTWTNVQLSSTSFTGDGINGDVRFGEYIGVDAFAGKVIPAWTDDRAGKPNQEIYTANVAGIPKSGSPIALDISKPRDFSLQQNYPNPFSTSTSFTYSIPEDCFVQFTIYDAFGRRIKALLSDGQARGSYTIQWNGADELGNVLPSGLYIYRIVAKGREKEFVAAKQMVLMR